VGWYLVIAVKKWHMRKYIILYRIIIHLANSALVAVTQIQNGYYWRDSMPDIRA
jgi:hypothetical protein